MKSLTILTIGLLISGTVIADGVTHSRFTSKGDPAEGRARSALCGACHGIDGYSPNDIWPNLAGQRVGYLVKQLKAFRDNERSDPSMSPMAVGLSDQDIEDLAAYYASLR